MCYSASISTNKIQGTGGGVWFRVWLMTTSKHLISHASFEFLQQGIEYHALYAGENTEHCVYRETGMRSSLLHGVYTFIYMPFLDGMEQLL